jgi:hypothetical protein
MTAGLRNDSQLNALATLNIRGERSLTCRGEFGRHLSQEPLPPGAPPVWEASRPRASCRGPANHILGVQPGDTLVETVDPAWSPSSKR